MKLAKLFAAFIVATASFGGSARADTISYNFSAIVTNVLNNGSGAVDIVAGVGLNDIVAGTFSYDTASTAGAGAGTLTGAAFYATGNIALTLASGTFYTDSATYDPSGLGTFVFNDDPVSFDSLNILGVSSSGVLIVLGLQDSTSTVFNSKSLPLGLSLSSFDAGGLTGPFIALGVSVCNGDDCSIVQEVDLSITALTAAVPESSTWIMLILGFGFVACFSRRGRGKFSSVSLRT